MTVKLYALRHKATSNLLCVSINGIEQPEFSGTYEATLENDEYSKVVWTTNDYEHARKVAQTHTEWYNAGIESPGNPFVGQLEVVEFCAHGIM
jgi:hypothetical protein